MNKYNASIEFESRHEVEELMRIVAQYVKDNPKEKNNEVLRAFYHQLDVIDMSW